jgi:hypothetical protein
MNTASDAFDGGIGGPGIWDQMPLVPPTAAPKEVDDSELIWSKPTLTKQRRATPTMGTKKTTVEKSTKKKTAKRKKTTKKTVKKKTAGRSKKRR